MENELTSNSLTYDKVMQSVDMPHAHKAPITRKGEAIIRAILGRIALFKDENLIWEDEGRWERK